MELFPTVRLQKLSGLENKSGDQEILAQQHICRKWLCIVFFVFLTAYTVFRDGPCTPESTLINPCQSEVFLLTGLIFHATAHR